MNLTDDFQNLNSLPTTKSFQAWRSLAQKKVTELPFPTRKQEEWKYTNLDELKATSWQSNFGTTAIGQKDNLQAEYSKFLLSQFETISFINGSYQKATLQSLPVRFTSELSETEFHTYFSSFLTEDYFELLNRAWSQEGLIIEIPAGKSYDKPLCIDFYYSSSDLKKEPLAAHPRIFINVGASANLKLIFRTFGKESYFNNLVARVNLAKDSHVEFVNFQANFNSSYSFTNIDFSLAENSTLKSFNISLSGKLNRERLNIRHQGHGASSFCYGAYLTQEQAQSDHYTNIEHLVGQGKSVQLYKGLLSDESRAVFNGRVFIAPGAIKTDSTQLNNNLLLSSKAEIDSKPQLEILADDVKATHGTTVGQLDEEEIFYLQSRGISKTAAIQLLARGFVFEILSHVEDKMLQTWLKSQLAETLNDLKISDDQQSHSPVQKSLEKK